MTAKTYDPDNFPAMLAECREAAGLSQSQAARNAGIAHSSWWSYEHGEKCPSLMTAAKLLNAVGVTMVIGSRRTSGRDHG